MSPTSNERGLGFRVTGSVDNTLVAASTSNVGSSRNDNKSSNKRNNPNRPFKTKRPYLP